MLMRDLLGRASIMLTIFWLETESVLEEANDKITDFLRLCLKRSTSACECRTSVSVEARTSCSLRSAAT